MRYHPSDLAEFAPPKTPPAKVATVPACRPAEWTQELGEKLDRFRGENNRLDLTWKGERGDLKDDSPSGYCLAVADALVAANWEDAEIIAALSLWRSLHRAGSKYPAWYSRTIAKARTTSQNKPTIEPPTAPDQIGYLLRELYSNPDILKMPEAIVHGVLYPDALTVLAGREKSGKSTLMGYYAAKLSHYAVVLWFGLEESLGDPVRRFKRFGANPDNLTVVDRINSIDDIVKAQEQTGATVIFVDSLSRVGEGTVTDWHSSGQVTPVMTTLSDLCHHKHVSIILSHHAKKADGKYRDSTAIGANADLILEMFGDDVDPTVRRFEARGRMTVEPFALKFTDEVYEPVGGGHLSIRDRVLRFISQNPGSSKRKIRTAITGTNALKDQATGQLETDGMIENRGSGNGTAWHTTEKGLGTVSARSSARSGEQGETQWGIVSAQFRHGERTTVCRSPLGGWESARCPDTPENGTPGTQDREPGCDDDRLPSESWEEFLERREVQTCGGGA